MENRGLFYSPILHGWRVKILAGADKKSFLNDGDDFDAAFDTLFGPHAAVNLPKQLLDKEAQNDK